MTAAAKQLAKQALALPEKERVRLVQLLQKSLSEEGETLSQEEWNEAWKRELAKRVAEIESGAVKCIPYSEVRKRLNKIIRKA